MKRDVVSSDSALLAFGVFVVGIFLVSVVGADGIDAWTNEVDRALYGMFH